MNRPKRIALIGHRGVGKSSLLHRLSQSNISTDRKLLSFDLDREIEMRTGRSVSAIFHEDGESQFRKLEISVIAEIESAIQDEESDVVIAVGAGFEVQNLNPLWHAVWIRRATDESGRIFTDRPRLDSNLSALEEFRTRSSERTPRFAARADDVLILDEGSSTVDRSDVHFFQNQIRGVGGALTLLPENFARGFEMWVATRVAWGIRWFELRDDLLSTEQMKLAASLIPAKQVLVSFRKSSREIETLTLGQSSGAAIDWPVERGDAPDVVRGLARSRASYLSLHEKLATLEETFARLESSATNLSSAHVSLKAALPIETFQDLMIGHQWQLRDPSRRVFLPMSADGRWNWYRQLRGSDYSLNFFRESAGSALDQPTLLQWIRRHSIQTRDESKNSSGDFAAVLGDPVVHSRTPMEQARFFSERQMSVFSVRVTEDDWRAGALESLIQLGLRAAAVTAPLKKLAFALLEEADLDDVTRKMASANTLFIQTRIGSPSIRGTNTDLEGLRVAIEKGVPNAQSEATVIWGGGGTLDVVSEVFPRAQKVSARTGKIRNTNATPQLPSLVIWAANLKESDAGPPSEWRPQMIFDLNYSEASTARAYALKVGAKYVSGLAMFEAQAQAQREFWARCWETK